MRAENFAPKTLAELRALGKGWLPRRALAAEAPAAAEPDQVGLHAAAPAANRTCRAVRGGTQRGELVRRASPKDPTALRSRKQFSARST